MVLQNLIFNIHILLQLNVTGNDPKSLIRVAIIEGSHCPPKIGKYPTKIGKYPPKKIFEDIWAGILAELPLPSQKILGRNFFFEGIFLL